MVRLVEETIEVRVSDPQRTGERGQEAEGEGAPEQFLWQGRLYRVTEVVDHWQERRAWWRAATERPLAQASLGREVWRVTASPGAAAAPGVYDLGADGPSHWLLLRTQD